VGVLALFGMGFEAVYCSDCFGQSPFLRLRGWENGKVMSHFVAPRAGVDVAHDSMTYIKHINCSRIFDNEAKTQKIHACNAS